MARSNFPAAMILLLLAVCAPAARAEGPLKVRIKDITQVEGDRVNQLFGMGLVTGLNGTGGKSPVTRQFALNMLERLGNRAAPALRLAVRDDAKQRTDNVSVVTVSAELSTFAKPGSMIDVTVSAFDDATSLQGGTLVLTPLLGVDNQVYVMASGPVSIGGFSFSGQAATVQKNHPTTGRVPGRSIVERAVPHEMGTPGVVRLLLRHADFETARRITDAINAVFPATAAALDAGTVHISVPLELQRDPVGFVAHVNGLCVVPDMPARVVINERTGTIVVGKDVRLSTVAITHANLAVITGETPEVSQPAPFGRGRTAVVPRTTLDVVEEDQPVRVVDTPVTVGDLARALNALGVTPRDLSAIFQQLKVSGALHAELLFK